jgi:alternate signal-mediated exported protein
MSKKMTKGAVAVAAGVVLLLGGAGTYALWEVNRPLDGTVQAGDLDLSTGAATWTLNGEEVTSPETLRVVPGDVLTVQQELTVTAVGDSLQAQLSVDEVSPLVDPSLAEYFDVDLTVDAPWATDNADGTYAVEPSDTAQVVDADVSITFAESTPEREGANAQLDLGNLEFTLEQLAGS